MQYHGNDGEALEMTVRTLYVCFVVFELLNKIQHNQCKIKAAAKEIALCKNINGFLYP